MASHKQTHKSSTTRPRSCPHTHSDATATTHMARASCGTACRVQLLLQWLCANAVAAARPSLVLLLLPQSVVWCCCCLLLSEVPANAPAGVPPTVQWHSCSGARSCTACCCCSILTGLVLRAACCELRHAACLFSSRLTTGGRHTTSSPSRNSHQQPATPASTALKRPHPPLPPSLPPSHTRAYTTTPHTTHPSIHTHVQVQTKTHTLPFVPS